MQFQQTKNNLASCGKALKLRKGVLITHPENVHLGNYVGINYNCCIMGQGGVHIGDYCVLGPGSKIITVGHPIGGMYYSATYQEPVILGKNVWLGAGAIVLPGVTIGDHVIIGAGAVVSKSIPAGKVALGIPARIRGDVPFNAEEYEYQVKMITEQGQSLIVPRSDSDHMIPVDSIQ